MDTTRKLEEDVAFVRQAVESRDQKQYTSIAIAVVWAVIIAVGFTLNDFKNQASGTFWLIAPMVGFFLSLWLGKKGQQDCGVENRSDMRKHTMHWGSLFVISAVVMSIAFTHKFEGWVIGQLFTLLSGVALFFGGLHLDRRFLLPGAVLIIGAAALDYLAPYPWTTVGLVTSASLIISAIWMRPAYEEATD